MTPNLNDFACRVVALALSGVDVSEREALLVAMLNHAAAGLIVIEGREGAAEKAFQLADSIIEGQPR
jgi:hypothetical protein